MSRLSRYNFRGDAKYGSVIEEEEVLQPKEDTYEEVTAKNEQEINEICNKCHQNEIYWSEVKFKYIAVECCAILSCMCLSLISVAIAAYFFPAYRDVFSYLEKTSLVPFALFVQLPLLYLILECVSVCFDLMRVHLSTRLLRMFAAERKDHRLLGRRVSENPYLINGCHENTITLTVINTLKRRVDVKTQFKKMFRSIIRLEVFINLYFFLFVIGSKILAASYIQINLINSKSSPNSTEIFEIDNTFAKTFSCCETDDSPCKTSYCVQENVNQYLQLLVVVFYTTACMKFLIQLWLLGNLKINLMDRLVNKKYVEEWNLKRKYDKCRSKQLSEDVKKRIEDSEVIISKQLYSDGNTNHHYAEIKI